MLLYERKLVSLVYAKVIYLNIKFFLFHREVWFAETSLAVVIASSSLDKQRLLATNLIRFGNKEYSIRAINLDCTMDVVLIQIVNSHIFPRLSRQKSWKKLF